MRFIYARTNADDVTFIVNEATKRVLYQAETQYFPRFDGLDGLEESDKKAITKKIARKYLNEIEESSVFERMLYRDFENYFTEDIEIITECKRDFDAPEIDEFSETDEEWIETHHDEYVLTHPEDDDYMTYQEAIDEYGGEPSFVW